jgi:uncharacterized protein (TIGR03437 family)
MENGKGNNDRGGEMSEARRSMRLASLMAAVLLLSIVAKANGHRTPIASGYGANGEYALRVDRFPSPLYERADVVVFRPEGVPGKVPVIFFAPGYTNNDPDEYRGLITHIVSRGYAVVFTPFQLVSGDLTLNEKRYDTIWEGMRAAVERYGESFDLDRVGHLGHSYGGAAIFAMALRGYEREGWGRKAMLLFSTAPWYYFQVGVKEFVNFPAHAKLVVQVYEDDRVNDHRMARDLFERVNLPSSEKDFMLVRSDQRGGLRIDAGHGAPESRDSEDAIDFYAIYRTFDGLAGYAFNGEAEGKRIALGNGAAEQRSLGEWVDGRPIREMLVGDCVEITRAPLSFLFPYLGGGAKGLKSVSSASLRPTALAPDSLMRAWGTNFSLYPESSESGPVSELNGTVVKVKDGACVERIAPLFFVSPTEVRYLVPAESAPGSGTVSIYNADGGQAISAVTIALFSANGTGEGPAAMSVLRIGADGVSRYENPLQYDFGAGGYIALPIEPAQSGERLYLILYGTGLRHRSSLARVRAMVGGMPVGVEYAGPQADWAGVDQINLPLPSGLRGMVDVRLTVDDLPTNTVRVNLR